MAPQMKSTAPTGRFEFLFLALSGIGFAGPLNNAFLVEVVFALPVIEPVLLRGGNRKTSPRSRQQHGLPGSSIALYLLFDVLYDCAGPGSRLPVKSTAR